jgi:transposase
VDNEASGGGDSRDFPHTLPLQQRRKTPASAQLVPAKARRPSFGAGRKGHPALEEEGLAPGKKNAARLGAHLVFADESGFLLAPLVVRTWAPRGSTPLLHYRQGRREKISVISGISLSSERHHPGLYYLIVLLDNSSTHNDEGELMQKLLARHPRLKIEHFPSYAPELNPDEGVWALAKKELANGCPKNVEGLMESIICAIDRIRKSPAKLRGCILQSDLPLFLS